MKFSGKRLEVKPWISQMAINIAELQNFLARRPEFIVCSLLYFHHNRKVDVEYTFRDNTWHCKRLQVTFSVL